MQSQQNQTRDSYPQHEVAKNVLECGELAGCTSEKEGATKEETMARQLYGAVLEAALDCIIVMDHQGRITEFNPAAVRTFGYEREKAIGQPLAELIVPPSLRAQHNQGLARYFATGCGAVLGKRIEIEALHAEGHTFPVELAIVPLNIQSQTQFVGYLRDITDRHRAERERHEAEVEKEVILARERAARAEVEVASRFRDEFLSLVSHELRTPLTPLRGWAELLLANALDESSARQALEAIVQSVEDQSRLVDELLDVSCIVAGKIKLQLTDVSLASLIFDSLDSVAKVAQAKSIAFKADLKSGTGYVRLDPFRVRQALLHLLSNAIKFTPPGGFVEVSASFHNCEVQIQVKDNGQGIAPDLLPYVFDPLRQADSSLTRGTGGLGLGLTLVRHIVELHGGRVLADSPGNGLGTTVTLYFPLNSQAVLPSFPAETWIESEKAW